MRWTLVKLPPTKTFPPLSAKAETSLLPSIEEGPAPSPAVPQGCGSAKLSAEACPVVASVPESGIAENRSSLMSCGRRNTWVKGRA